MRVEAGVSRTVSPGLDVPVLDVLSGGNRITGRRRIWAVGKQSWLLRIKAEAADVTKLGTRLIRNIKSSLA